MTNLYEINKDIENLLNCEEMTEDIEKEFESLQMKFDDKAENILKFMKDQELEAKKFDEEINRLSKRKNSMKKKASWLKAYLDTILRRQWIEKAEYGSFKISYIKSQRVIVDEEKIGKKWIKKTITTSVDKMGIKEEIKIGKKIKWAYIEEAKNLQIK